MNIENQRLDISIVNFAAYNILKIDTKSFD